MNSANIDGNYALSIFYFIFYIMIKKKRNRAMLKTHDLAVCGLALMAFHLHSVVVL